MSLIKIKKGNTWQLVWGKITRTCTECDGQCVSCTGGCSNSCTGGCTGCSDTCQGGCGESCYGCLGNCEGKCADCTGYCLGSCDGSCKGERTDCGSGKYCTQCGTQCWVACTDRCQSGCEKGPAMGVIVGPINPDPVTEKPTYIETYRNFKLKTANTFRVPSHIKIRQANSWRTIGD